MNYIIEAHRQQDSVSPVQYAVIVDTFISNKDIKSFDVYTTVNDLKSGIKIGTVNDVEFKTMDIDTKFDTYYVALDVPDEWKELMHEGRGAFIANIVNDKVEHLDYVQKGGQ